MMARLVSVIAPTRVSRARRANRPNAKAASAMSPRPASAISWMFGRYAITLIVTSSVIGVAAAYASRDLMKTFVTRAEESNWPLIAVVAGLLAAVTLVAALIPARRAARLDPMTALRHE